MAMTRSTSASVGPKVAWVRKRAACSRELGISATAGAVPVPPVPLGTAVRCPRRLAAAATAAAAGHQQQAGAQHQTSPGRAQATARVRGQCTQLSLHIDPQRAHRGAKGRARRRASYAGDHRQRRRRSTPRCVKRLAIGARRLHADASDNLCRGCYSEGARWRRATARSIAWRRAQSSAWSSPMRPTLKYAASRMRQVEAADAGRRRHRQALGQAHADGCGLQHAEHVALDAVVGAGRVARRGADAAVLLGDQFLGATAPRRRHSPRTRCARAGAAARRRPRPGGRPAP